MNFNTGFISGGVLVGGAMYILMAKSICVFGHCFVF